MNNYGIMQGRLLPKFKGNYQSHPIGYWQKEYQIASKLPLKKVEFIFDLYLYSHNPIFSDLDQVIKVQKHTGIQTSSICADFFMNAPIHKASKDERNIFKKILFRLIKNLSKLGGTDIVIPFVDNSKINNVTEEAIIVEFLNSTEKICDDNKINLSLETDFNPSKFLKFIKKFDKKYVIVNYDSGNSASLGFSIKKELDLLGDKITNIHIKDRLLNGNSIELGKGDTNLKYLKNFITKNDYSGVVTFQAFRDDEGISIFEKQFKYFQEL